MSNVVDLTDFRKPTQRTEASPSAEQLRAMPYRDLIQWCGNDFNRLVAAVNARGYWPRWIEHQLASYRERPSAREAMVIEQMIAEAGPFLNRRQRWVMRKVRLAPLTKAKLAEMAAHAVEYTGLKRFDIATRNDVIELIRLGLIAERDGLLHPVDSGKAPQRREAAPSITVTERTPQ
jgi:hypothetical protein